MLTFLNHQYNDIFIFYVHFLNHIVLYLQHNFLIIDHYEILKYQNQLDKYFNLEISNL